MFLITNKTPDVAKSQLKVRLTVRATKAYRENEKAS